MYVLTQAAHVLTLIAAIAAFVAPAAAQEPQVVRILDGNRPRTFISVTGEGEATAPPDMATIRAGVATQAATAKEALNQNNATMQSLIALVKEHEIADKDVQTSSFNVHPIYDHSPETRKVPEAIEYRVVNEVQVKVRNLSTLGDVLDALVETGSNQISGVSFELDTPHEILNEARARAVHNAKSRAEVYAEAAGVEVGRVLQISEQPVDVPRPMHLGVEFRAEAAGVPVATGEQEFRVTVNVVYELARRRSE